MSRFGGMGSGGGGAGGGGGAMFRTVSRVARAGLTSPSSSSTSTNSPQKASKRGFTLCNKATDIPSASVSLSNSGFPPAWTLSSSSSLCDDESEWACVHDEDRNDSFDAFVFRSARSPTEVTSALLSLQQTLPTSCTSDFDWIEPSMHMYGYDQRISGIVSVYDALHLLQTDPSVQRMVISLSSDGTVWDAVLNNEAVQELRESFYNGAVMEYSRSKRRENNLENFSSFL